MIKWALKTSLRTANEMIQEFRLAVSILKGEEDARWGIPVEVHRI